MFKLFPTFEDKNIQLKHDILISYALFILFQSVFTAYSTFNIGSDKSVFLSTTLASIIIPIVIILFARKNFKLVSVIFICTVWTTSTFLLFIFKSDNSGMAYIIMDLFIKAALASLIIRWYSGIFLCVLTILAALLDQYFEQNQILNFLQTEPIPPMAYLVGLVAMLGTLGIIAVSNALSFEKIFQAYQAEFRKRQNAENLLIQQNLELESKVEKRTSEILQLNEELNTVNLHLNQSNEELSVKNIELSAAIEQLQLTQEQLIHSEKMASLGVLASGIAHEINNPLNFIASGIYSLENYLNDKLNGEDPELEQIRYVLQTGLDRSAAIITSLNRYSRKDTALQTACNIHAIIDSCLLMLQNQTKHRIEIRKKYVQEEIKLTCNESKIHQALLNILANAVQSIVNTGIISIETKFEQDWLLLTITDTGCGINKENLSKIFDPFYTTKEPGKGTGLGLSITYTILKEHDASIEYSSEIGKGTTVHIRIPLKRKIDLS